VCGERARTRLGSELLARCNFVKVVVPGQEATAKQFEAVTIDL